MSKTTHNKTVLQQTTTLSESQMILKRFLWLRNNFAYCLMISAIIWIVGVCYYIDNYAGWSSILSLSPADFGLFLLSVTLPLCLIWFILAYIERSSSLDANAHLFQVYINSLMYPDEDASQNAKAFSAALQEQIKQLQKESKAVIAQSAQLKTDLDTRVVDFSNILRLLDDYSAKTLTELNDNIKDLANRCAYITDKTASSAIQLKECSADISVNSDVFFSKITPILDEISAISSNIKSNITDNKQHLITIKEQLNACANISQQHINELLLKTDENTQRIEQSFYKTAEEYDSLYKRLDTSISSIEGRVEEQKRLIHTQTQVLDHNSDLLNNKLTKYGKNVSGEIDKLVRHSVELEKQTKKQIAALKTVNTETGKAIRGIGGIFDEKRAEIEQRCEYAVNSMQNVIIAINKETEKLMSFTTLTQAKNYDLQNISETIVDKIGDMSNKLALKTDSLKDKAVDVIEKFTQASELINRSTDKINVSSNLIVNNGKQGVKLLEEQNFYINNAITNMDLVREKLDKLHTDIKKVSVSVTKTLAAYEKQIDKMDITKGIETLYEPGEPDFDRDELITDAKGINRTFRRLGIEMQKLYNGQDLFDLWDNYLQGRQNVFTDILKQSLTHKQTLAIRKAFDDNAEFHNQVIRYLFLMDMLIKDMSSSTNRDELMNFAVNMSLDKIYFILVKALNSAG